MAWRWNPSLSSCEEGGGERDSFSGPLNGVVVFLLGLVVQLRHERAAPSGMRSRKVPHHRDRRREAPEAEQADGEPVPEPRVGLHLLDVRLLVSLRPRLLVQVESLGHGFGFVRGCRPSSVLVSCGVPTEVSSIWRARARFPLWPGLLADIQK